MSDKDVSKQKAELSNETQGQPKTAYHAQGQTKESSLLAQGQRKESAQGQRKESSLLSQTESELSSSQPQSTFLTEMSVVSGHDLTFFLAGFDEGRMSDMKEAVQAIQTTNLGKYMQGHGAGGNGVPNNNLLGSGLPLHHHHSNIFHTHHHHHHHHHPYQPQKTEILVDSHHIMQQPSPAASTSMRRGNFSGNGHGLYAKLSGKATPTIPSMAGVQLGITASPSATNGGGIMTPVLSVSCTSVEQMSSSAGSALHASAPRDVPVFIISEQLLQKMDETRPDYVAFLVEKHLKKHYRYRNGDKDSISENSFSGDEDGFGLEDHLNNSMATSPKTLEGVREGEIQKSPSGSQENLGNENILSVADDDSDDMKERATWQSMLTEVLKEDIITYERKKSSDTSANLSTPGKRAELMRHLWLELRSVLNGHSSQDEAVYLDFARNSIDTTIQDLIQFHLPTNITGDDAVRYVHATLSRISNIDSLYPTLKDMYKEKPLYGSAQFRCTYEALIAWHNTRTMLERDRGVLQAWLRNPKGPHLSLSQIIDNSDMIMENMLKENSLQTIVNSRVFTSIHQHLCKAKTAYHEHKDEFERLGLPTFVHIASEITTFIFRIIRGLLKFNLQTINPGRVALNIIEQLLQNAKLSLMFAIQSKTNYTHAYMTDTKRPLEDVIDETAFNALLDKNFGLYLDYVGVKMRLIMENSNLYKEADVLEEEWVFAKAVASNLVDGYDIMAHRFIVYKEEILDYMSKDLATDVDALDKLDGEADIGTAFRPALENLRLRTQKFLRIYRNLCDETKDVCAANVKMDRCLTVLQQGGYIAVRITGESEMIAFVTKHQHDMLGHRRKEIATTDLHDLLPMRQFMLMLRVDAETFKRNWCGKVSDMSFARHHVESVKTLAPHHDILALFQSPEHGIEWRFYHNFRRAIRSDPKVNSAWMTHRPALNASLAHVETKFLSFIYGIIDHVASIRQKFKGKLDVGFMESLYTFASNLAYRFMQTLYGKSREDFTKRMIEFSLQWLSFTCSDCRPEDRRTFRWCLLALEFVLLVTKGAGILSLGRQEFIGLRHQVACVVGLLISHFDIPMDNATSSPLPVKALVDRLQTGGTFDEALMKSFSAVFTRRNEWLLRIADIERRRGKYLTDRQMIGSVIETGVLQEKSFETFFTGKNPKGYLRWQQLQFIGGGTFGSVYQGLDLETGDMLAIKEIKFTASKPVSSYRDAIEEESMLIGNLSHPNIVGYYGFECHSDKIYVFMEYCPGGSLGSLLEHGRIDDQKVLKIYARQLLSAIAYMHERGIVHRDLKPENILFDDSGNLKICDFGAYKLVKSNLPSMSNASVQSLTGTAAYMAPESVTGETVNQKADIWSFGCTMLHMLTGKRPWHTLENQWAIMYNLGIAGNAVPPIPDASVLGTDCHDFLLKCLTRAPLERPSAEALLQHPFLLAHGE